MRRCYVVTPSCYTLVPWIERHSRTRNEMAGVVRRRRRPNPHLSQSSFLGIPGGLRHLTRAVRVFHAARREPVARTLHSTNLFTRSPLAGAFFKLFIFARKQQTRCRRCEPSPSLSLARWRAVSFSVDGCFQRGSARSSGRQGVIVLATDADLRDPARDLFLLAYVGPGQI